MVAEAVVVDLHRLISLAPRVGIEPTTNGLTASPGARSA